MRKKVRGHIRKRGKASWAVVVDLPRGPDGKRRQKWVSVRGTKKDAERVLRGLLTELDKGAYVEPQKLTVGEFMERWLRDCARGRVSPGTFETYQVMAREHIIGGPIGRIPLAELRPLHIQELYAAMLERGLSPSTVNYVHILLRQALGHAVRWQMLARNPAEAVDAPRRERKEMRALDAAQVQALVRGIKDLRLLVPVVLAVGCGLRRSEITGLRWEDVDFQGGRLHISQTVQRLAGKGLVPLPTKTHRSRRAVALPAAVAAILKAWRKQQAQERLAAGPAWRETGLVCTAPGGGPLEPDWITKQFRKAAGELGLPPVRFHDLRHTHATLLLKANVHPKVVSERMGHAQVGVTLDVYSHVLPGMQEEAALAIDQILRAASPPAV